MLLPCRVRVACRVVGSWERSIYQTNETHGAALRHPAAPVYGWSAEPEAQGTPRGRPKAPGSEMEVRLRCEHARTTDRVSNRWVGVP